MTLHLQQRRRRKTADTTLRYFRVAMFCLMAVSLLGGWVLWQPALADEPRAIVTLGVLMIAGVFVSAIAGMLYKVVPFICWLHLQRACGLNSMPPTMNQIIAEQQVRRQFYAHLLALVLLLSAIVLPQLAALAGALFALSCGWLGVNLTSAVLAYRRFRRRIPAVA